MWNALWERVEPWPRHFPWLRALAEEGFNSAISRQHSQQVGRRVPHPRWTLTSELQYHYNSALHLLDPLASYDKFTSDAVPPWFWLVSFPRKTYKKKGSGTNYHPHGCSYFQDWLKIISILYYQFQINHTFSKYVCWSWWLTYWDDWVFQPWGV